VGVVTGLFNMAVLNDTRVASLKLIERDQLRSIALRFKKVIQKEEKPDIARMLADIEYLLGIIGGEFRV